MATLRTLEEGTGNVTVSRSASRSIKAQIAEVLREQILNGSRPGGTQLPTEVELMEEHGVARNTARDALAILVNEGLIVPRRPHGYFVRTIERMDYLPQSDLRSHPRDAAQDIFLTDQSLAGRHPSQRIDVSITAPPTDVTNRLALEPGELTVVRRRVRYLDGQPFHINDSYYALSKVQGTEIMSPADIARGANVVLAEAGHVQVRATDEIYIRMPTPEEAQRLDLVPGTPVGYHIVTGYTGKDVAVRVALSVLPGDRHVIKLNRPGLDPESFSR